MSVSNPKHALNVLKQKGGSKRVTFRNKSLDAMALTNLHVDEFGTVGEMWAHRQAQMAENGGDFSRVMECSGKEIYATSGTTDLSFYFNFMAIRNGYTQDMLVFGSAQNVVLENCYLGSSGIASAKTNNAGAANLRFIKSAIMAAIGLYRSSGFKIEECVFSGLGLIDQQGEPLGAIEEGDSIPYAKHEIRGNILSFPDLFFNGSYAQGVIIADNSGSCGYFAYLSSTVSELSITGNFIKNNRYGVLFLADDNNQAVPPLMRSFGLKIKNNRFYGAQELVHTPAGVGSCAVAFLPQDGCVTHIGGELVESNTIINYKVGIEVSSQFVTLNTNTWEVSAVNGTIAPVEATYKNNEIKRCVIGIAVRSHAKGIGGGNLVSDCETGVLIYQDGEFDLGGSVIKNCSDTGLKLEDGLLGLDVRTVGGRVVVKDCAIGVRVGANRHYQGDIEVSGSSVRDLIVDVDAKLSGKASVGGSVLLKLGAYIEHLDMLAVVANARVTQNINVNSKGAADRAPTFDKLTVRRGFSGVGVGGAITIDIIPLPQFFNGRVKTRFVGAGFNNEVAEYNASIVSFNPNYGYPEQLAFDDGFAGNETYSDIFKNTGLKTTGANGDKYLAIEFDNAAGVVISGHVEIEFLGRMQYATQFV